MGFRSPQLKAGDSASKLKASDTYDLFAGEDLDTIVDEIALYLMNAEYVKTYQIETGSFTADYNYRYDLHSTAAVSITLPTWASGYEFEVLLDGDSKNHALTFLHDGFAPINGISGNVSASTKATGDRYFVLAEGEPGNEHWSVTRLAGI